VQAHALVDRITDGRQENGEASEEEVAKAKEAIAKGKEVTKETP